MRSATLQRVVALIESGDVRISAHGYDELAEDEILARDVLSGMRDSEVVEDYPNYFKGPSVLVLLKDDAGMPIHAVWGIPRNATEPAVLVTAYRPDPNRWSTDYMRRTS